MSSAKHSYGITDRKNYCNCNWRYRLSANTLAEIPYKIENGEVFLRRVNHYGGHTDLCSFIEDTRAKL